MRKPLIVGIAAVATAGLIYAGVQTNYPSHTLPPQGYGVINLNITQANISQNICNKNWSTKSIRPSASYTTSLKKKQLIDMKYSDTNTSLYEEDHLISLELGGHPTDPKNLWPEPWNIPYQNTDLGARSKDKVENYLHAQVCSGALTLQEAQKEIITNWVDVYNKIKKP